MYNDETYMFFVSRKETFKGDYIPFYSGEAYANGKYVSGFNNEFEYFLLDSILYDELERTYLSEKMEHLYEYGGFVSSELRYKFDTELKDIDKELSCGVSDFFLGHNAVLS